MHREGTGALVISAIFLVILNSLVFHLFATKIPFYILAVGSVIVYGLMINFFQCPVRLFEEDTEKTVVAPADGRVVVIQEEEAVGSRLKVMVNFGTPEELAFFRKKYQGEIYAFPFWKDPFASKKEEREWVWKIFQ